MENGVAVSMVDAVAQALIRAEGVLDCESSCRWSRGAPILDRWRLDRWRAEAHWWTIMPAGWQRRTSIRRAWGWGAWWSVAGHGRDWLSGGGTGLDSEQPGAFIFGFGRLG